MPGRKPYRKTNVLPREVDEPVSRMSVWLSKSDRDWLLDRYGTSNVGMGVRRLIASVKGGRPKKKKAPNDAAFDAEVQAAEERFTHVEPDPLDEKAPISQTDEPTS